MPSHQTSIRTQDESYFSSTDDTIGFSVPFNVELPPKAHHSRLFVRGRSGLPSSTPTCTTGSPSVSHSRVSHQTADLGSLPLLLRRKGLSAFCRPFPSAAPTLSCPLVLATPIVSWGDKGYPGFWVLASRRSLSCRSLFPVNLSKASQILFLKARSWHTVRLLF